MFGRGYIGNVQRCCLDPRVTVGVCVASAVILMVVMSIALRWDLLFVVIAGASFGLSTWLTRSITRAMICLFAAFGLFGLVYSIVASVMPTVVNDVRLSWSVGAIIVWALVVACALCSRQTSSKSEFSAAEMLGCWVAVAMALFVAVKIDYSHSLLSLLVHVEDNQAWVATTTQLHAAGGITTFNVLGPIIPTLEGVLLAQQRDGISMYNSTFSAYALAMILLPVVVFGLFRQPANRSRLGVIGFGLVATLWAYALPVLLFSSYGHLSAILVFLGLLVAVGAVVFEEVDLWSIPLVGGAIFFMGAAWFPIAPLGACLLVIFSVSYWRRVGRRGRLVIAVVAVLVMLALVAQVALVLNVRLGDGLGKVRAGLTSVYGSTGGTAAVDGLLLVLIIAAVVVFGLRTQWLDGPAHRLWVMCMVAFAYVVTVLTGAFLLKTISGYGPVKLQYLVGWAVLILLIAIAARLRLERSAVTAVLLGLVLLGFAIGGTGALVAGRWPGTGSNPSWLAAVEAVGNADDVLVSRSIGCFSSDKWQAYMCTRWVAGVIAAGDGVFLGYRLRVVNELDPAAAVNSLVESGQLANSGVIVLDPPHPDHTWGWRLINAVGVVYDGTGRVTREGSNGAKGGWANTGDVRWAKPGEAVVEAIRASPQSSGVQQIICYGSDPDETVSCSEFATHQLGGTTTQLLPGLKTGAEGAVDTALADGSLNRVVLLLLDLPAHEDLLPYQQRLFASVRSVYKVSPDGSITLVRAAPGWQ